MTLKQFAFRKAVQVGIVINRLLSPLGIRVSRRVSPIRTTWEIIRDFFEGRTEAYVVDVGAATGSFSADLLQLVPNVRIVCIEPIPRRQIDLKERFKGRDVRIIQAAVGDRDGEVVFHESVDPDCSSVLPMERHRCEFPSVSIEASSYTVPLHRLDTLLSDDQDDTPIDLLKIDVQGLELPVLLGAERTLSRCKSVLIEMSLRPLYEGQAPFEEVVLFMYNHGFRMVDYAEGARSHVTRELLQMDFLYQPLAAS